MNPDANFDALFIIRMIGERFGDCAKSEIFNFAYLSCLLSLYDQSVHMPTTFWGYKFIANEIYAPYSFDIDNALAKMTAIGILEESNNFYKITEKGLGELSILQTLTSIKKREKYLSAACFSAYSLPIGHIRRAVSNVPFITKAKSLNNKYSLFDDDLFRLYQDFAILRAAIGLESKDLLIPSTIWLQCMAEKR